MTVQCGTKDFPSCDARGAPPGFCCPKDKNCLTIAAGTTILCCPMDSTCVIINPIDCDLGLQVPGSDIQSTCRKGRLPWCGRGCCPWGYKCGNTGSDISACYAVGGEINLPPSGCLSSEISSATTSSSSKPTSATDSDLSLISMELPTGTLASSGIESSPTTSQSAASTGGPLSIADLVGIALGSFFGVGIIVIALYFVCRKYKKQHGNEQGQDTTAFASQDQPVKESKIPDRPELPTTQVFELPG
ncbi:hypothetical protein F5Y04DRAFT_287826 [Hypomontagnella monticulosa]|nr:hypothetical protein F5Y04DRAFT_287826 [Hypomontagnella monticulosa]